MLPIDNVTLAWTGLSWLCATLGTFAPHVSDPDGSSTQKRLRLLAQLSRHKFFAGVNELLQRPECASMTQDSLLVKLRRTERDTAGQIDSGPMFTTMSTLAVNQMTLIGGNSDAKSDTEEEFWPLYVRILMSVVFVGLSVVGIVGNFFVVTVVRKVPGMITPTNCYLTSLAVSDSLFFVAAAPTELSYLHVSSSTYVFGHVGCALFSYLPYLAINTSSLSISAFTVERFIGICYPLRARYICTVKRAQHIIFVIWVFCILYNSPWLYLATLKLDSHGQVCGFKLERDSWAYKVMFLNDFAAFYLIPMVLYVFMYGKIIFTLSRCEFQNSKDKESSKFTDKCVSFCDNTSAVKPLVIKTHSNVSPITTRAERPMLDASVHRNSTHGKVQVVKMLALVVLIFAVCWLPYRIMVMYNSFVSAERWDADWYIFLAKTLIFFNCSVNPILYSVMSTRFRGAFRRLLKERRC